MGSQGYQNKKTQKLNDKKYKNNSYLLYNNYNIS